MNYSKEEDSYYNYKDHMTIIISNCIFDYFKADSYFHPH